MLESPLIQELLDTTACQTAQRDILDFLEERFGEVSLDLRERLQSVTDEDRLRALVRKAAACPDLDAFRKELATER